MEENKQDISSQGRFQNIETLRDQVINYALIAFGILGLISWMFLLFSSFRAGFSQLWEITVHTLAIIFLVVVTINRKKLHLNFKILLISLIIVGSTIANFAGFGLFANAKIFVSIFPIFLSFVLPFRKTLAAMVLLLIIYGIFGYLFSRGILQYNFDLEEYATNANSWIIGIVIVVFVSFGLLLVGYFYSKALVSNYNTIQAQNHNLLNKEKKYRLLFESSNDAIVIIKGSQYFNCNSKTFSLFKCDPSYVLHKSPWEISPVIQPDGELSQKKAESIFARAFMGEAQVFDWQHSRPDSTLFNVSISLNTLEIDNQTYVQAVLRDITEKKLTEEELEKYRNHLEMLVIEKTNDLQSANEELRTINDELYSKNEIIIEQKNELEKTLHHLQNTQKQLIHAEKMASIGVLTSGIAHEINNPINFISSGITGLKMEINDIISALKECEESGINNPNTQQQFKGLIHERIDIRQSIENIPKLMESINTGVDRTINIVNGLRTFSRMDDEIKHMAYLSELIQSTLTILHNKYKNHIEVKTSFCDKDQIKCYPGKLGQLFLNLIMNAIQAIENHGTIEISTHFIEQHNLFKVIVRDNGSGIPVELQQKIFDPFFTTKPIGQGTGLGLSISHGIVSDHNGRIKLHSEVGKGTEITVLLPKI